MSGRLKFLKLALNCILIVSCAACSVTSNGKTSITPSPLSTYSADPNSEKGSRNNPIAIGDSVLINDWELQITSVNKDALELVMDKDPYANPPPSKQKYVMIETKATYVGDESGEPSTDLRFKIVGSRGNTFSKSCSYAVDTFEDNGETFPGATIAGNLCFVVDAEQIIGATLSIQGDYLSDRKFVSLD